MDIQYNQTNIPLPKLVIVRKIKQAIEYHALTKQKNPIEKLFAALTDLLPQQKLESPTFRAEYWKIEKVDNTITITFKDSDEPQIVVSSKSQKQAS